MKFTPDTLQELRNKIEVLEDQRTAIKNDLDHFSGLAAKYQAKYDEATAAIDDYAALLEYAEITNGFGKLTFHDVEGSPTFAVGDWVMVGDRSHKDYGRHGNVIGFVYNPDRVVVEYGSAGNTLAADASALEHAVRIAVPDPDVPAPTVADMRAIFGEPVQGRDYDEMPPAPEGGVR